MKKIIKRLLTGVLAFATVCTSLPASQVMAKGQNRASKSTLRIETHSQYGYEFYSSYPAPFNSKSGWQEWATFHMNVNNSGTENLVYCIQYSAIRFTGDQYGTSWEKKIVDNLLQDNAAARKIYDKIRANMKSYDTIPSFTASSESKAKDYELKYNMNNGKYELSLTYSNNVLKYFDFDSSGISINRSGNKLNLSSSKAFDTNTLKVNKNLPKDELPTLIAGGVGT